MKLVNTQPTSGQFIAVWVYNEEVWSDVYRWDDGALFMYDVVEDEWVHKPDGLVISGSHRHLWQYVIK